MTKISLCAVTLLCLAALLAGISSPLTTEYYATDAAKNEEGVFVADTDTATDTETEA